MSRLSPDDLLRLSLGTFSGHRLRTALSMLGIAIGVAAVILLTSLGEGARRYMVEEFSQFGTNLLQIQPGKTLVRMMLTTPFCPYAPQIMEEVKLASRSVVDQECEVEIMPDAWSPEMMPDPGLLGFSY